MTVHQGSEPALNVLFNRSIFSPDKDLLEKYKWHIVFVYDKLKGYTVQNNLFLGDAKFLGRAATVRESYTLKHYKNETWMINRPNMGAHSPVMGEAYAVDTKTLFMLDEYYENTSKYIRDNEYIRLYDQYAPTKETSEFKNVTVSSKAYFLRPGHFKNVDLEKFQFAARVHYSSKWHWSLPDYPT